MTQLQQLLVQAGVETAVDGRFGDATRQAVRRFQKAAGLEASGAAGKKTIAALRSAAPSGGAARYGGSGSATGSSSAKSLGDRIPLRPGMSGHDVKVLQDFLGRAGFTATVDGEFGDGTLTALKAFEAANTLAVDELVDRADIDVLRGLVRAGGGARVGATPPTLGRGITATVGSDGLAIAPADAPDVVKRMIAAGNKIAKTPYIYGGGHANFPNDRGYDCSGSMSYVLWGGDLLENPLVSSDFPSWGDPGPGQWVTLYGNTGHAYMVVAGLRFDTSGVDKDGSRWHASSRSTSGYGVSHPPGL
ncbi:peptidoglycan-binding protein [Paraconexibacter antarcticus]|uniref:Peptidoglycan-binding protein n=1 Tax=Paraconexibacter antarcticus TaxID=2949664 RepID=A0ABY5DRH8_9ACTN|nr:peptidoglycan-binding protein [Paraconexibacter antarcticus]UTI63357.1 peptidoglycan-binding protein [Paraconexibacter antarcticus]